MARTIINTTRRIYWFDENYDLKEITQFDGDPFYNVEVLEPVNEGQFRNLYICTNNYRRPKRWDGIAEQVSDLGGLIDIGVIRARTMEINNSHVIFANIAKNGGGAGGTNVIDKVHEIIDSLDVIIDLYGTTEDQGYMRFNKSLIWSDINRPEVYVPDNENSAGDLDFDETGDEIIRVKKLAEFNPVYKERSIWLLINVGLPFVYVKKFVTNSVGLLAVNAIVEVENVHYLVGGDLDIWRFDGVNVKNISGETGIKDYIISRVDKDYLYETHAYADTDRKEIYFCFRGKEDHTREFRDFEIVFNYENQRFFKRDSVAKCGGYFEQTPMGPLTIDQFTDVVINDMQDLIDNAGITGVPKWKLLIGDRNGKLYLQNEGHSFDGLAIDAIIETGDEDYAGVSNGKLSDHVKLMQALQVLTENQGVPKNFEVYIGTKDYMDHKIFWEGPFTFLQDASGTPTLQPRSFGVYHRLKFRLNGANRYIRILGYVPNVEDHGQLNS